MMFDEFMPKTLDQGSDHNREAGKQEHLDPNRTETVKAIRSTSTPVVLAAMVIIIAGISYAESIINPLLMALFTAAILVPPIEWLTRYKVPQWLATVIAILGLLGLYLTFFELLASSWSRFVRNAPQYQQNLEDLTESTLVFLSAKGIDISAFGDSSVLDPSRIMQYTALVINRLADVMTSEFTFLLLTIFLLLEMDSVHLKAKALTRETDVSLEDLRSLGDSIRHYLSIKTMTSLLTGASITVALALIGVDYPVLWGVVAFLLNYIPNIGSVIAAIPAIAFALIQLGFQGALWTLGVFVVVNIVIGNGIEPKIMGKGMGLSTFVVFFALIFWGFVLGPVGMFLSVPLTMLIKLMVARNAKTEWIATLLGTEAEALARLKQA
jgi:AI-2 transport protein TqsA